MNIKVLEHRSMQKYDTSENWANVPDFVPLLGEIIIYAADESCDYERLKIGNGVTTIANLPFGNDFITNEEIDTVCGVTILNGNDAEF